MLTPVEGVRRVVSLSQPTDPAERAGTASGDGDRGPRIRRAQAGRLKARASKIARAHIGKGAGQRPIPVADFGYDDIH